MSIYRMKIVYGMWLRFLGKKNEKIRVSNKVLGTIFKMSLIQGPHIILLGNEVAISMNYY